MNSEPTVGICVATVADAEAIAPFHVACWHEAYTGLVPASFLDALDAQDRVSRWQARLARSDCDNLIASDRAGAVVGVASTRPSEDDPPTPVLELSTLYLARTHYGTGLGAALVDRILDGRAASLWVFAGNARARSFYVKTGWHDSGHNKPDPGTGIVELRMVRTGHRTGQP
ncbi:MAG: GNAT family N-acetyltransferase [Jatrophihabitantaceae bacterium]